VDHYRSYYKVEQPAAPEARYHEWLERAESLVGKGRLLEVGAGNGGFVKAAIARGWRVDATEISNSALELLRSTGARVLAGDLGEIGLSDATYDLVASLEVVEHLPDPAAHLRDLARLTRPGGALLITTPNFAGLSRRLFGMRWRVVDPEHLGYFEANTLRRALRDAGFASVSVGTRTLDVTTWHATLFRAARPRFDPQAAATMRLRVEASRLLRLAKHAVNASLGMTGLGDALLAWAVR
jgi:2-polyprenyl-3-methyl-5-hydroxy-6-metoxy-1,4-benzoquinol methylase